jgi:hypothetical protein
MQERRLRIGWSEPASKRDLRIWSIAVVVTLGTIYAALAAILVVALK